MVIKWIYYIEREIPNLIIYHFFRAKKARSKYIKNYVTVVIALFTSSTKLWLIIIILYMVTSTSWRIFLWNMLHISIYYVITKCFDYQFLQRTWLLC